MSEIELTDEDMSLIYGRSAKAAFISAVASCFLRLAEHPDGEALQDLLLTDLKASLKKRRIRALRIRCRWTSG